MSDKYLCGAQMDEVMRAYVAIESDNPSEEEALGRLVALFNRIYCMGQEQEQRDSSLAEVAIRNVQLYNQNGQLLLENKGLRARVAALEEAAARAAAAAWAEERAP